MLSLSPDWFRLRDDLNVPSIEIVNNSIQSPIALCCMRVDASWQADMCRDQNTGSNIRTICQHKQILRSKVQRIPRRDHELSIQGPQDPATSQGTKIQGPQHPAGIKGFQYPRPTGSRDEIKG